MYKWIVNWLKYKELFYLTRFWTVPPIDNRVIITLTLTLSVPSPQPQPYFTLTSTLNHAQLRFFLYFGFSQLVPKNQQISKKFSHSFLSHCKTYSDLLVTTVFHLHDRPDITAFGIFTSLLISHHEEESCKCNFSFLTT